MTYDHIVIHCGAGDPVRRHRVAFDLGDAYLPQPLMLDEVGGQLDAGNG